MPTLIALLRAVNVAGHGTVAMADLRSFVADLGFRNPRSVLQSGNLVFEAAATPASVERRLEAEAPPRLGLQAGFFVRTAEDWRKILARNPFPDQAKHDPSHLVVMVLKAVPSDESVRALRGAIAGREEVVVGARHLYITYPDGQGRSRFTGAVIEKALGTRGTARNWNTVTRIAALAGA
jgi:uncharacterized protein (DUF1697 family)